MSSTATLAYILISLVLGYTFVYPQITDITELNRQKNEQQSSLDMVTQIENKKNELLTQFNNIPEAERKNVDTLLPNSLDFVKLVSDIDSVASKYGIAIDKVSSKEISATNGNSIETAEAGKIYKSSTVSFSFRSSYSSFQNFVKELEQSLRILDLRSIRLDGGEKGTYAYTIEFEVYFLNHD